MFLRFLLLFCMILASGVSFAQSPQRWQFAMASNETSNFVGRVTKQFIDEINQNSNNELFIQLHSRGSLISAPQTLRAVRTLQIQMGETQVGFHGNEDPFFEVEGIPFLADTWNDTIAIRQAADPYIKERLERRGVTLLYSITWPSQGIYTNQPIRSVEDLKGQRMRTYNPITTRMAMLAGAHPVNVVVAEVPQAFVSGIINSMFTSAQTGVDTFAWDYSRYFTDIGGMRNRTVIIINTASYNSLSEKTKNVIIKAAQKASVVALDEARKAEVEASNLLRLRGMQTPTPSPELMRGLRSIGTQLAGEWVHKAGPDGAAFMTRYRELQRTLVN